MGRDYELAVIESCGILDKLGKLSLKLNGKAVFRLVQKIEGILFYLVYKI